MDENNDDIKTSKFFDLSSSIFLVIIGVSISLLVLLGVYILFFRVEIDPPAWIGFWAAILGGGIGCSGAIYAVYVTTKETRKIQEKAQENFEYDKKMQKEMQRKLFTDDIAVITSEYITDIFKYYYNNRHSKLIKDDLANAKNEISKLIAQSKQNSEKSETLLLEAELAKLNYNEAERVAELRVIDKSIAIQKYYLLKIKLRGIDLAKQFVDQLEDIESVHCFAGIDPTEFNVEIEKLRTYLFEFSSQYIK